MTDLEWDKYVQEQAKDIFVPQWGMFYVPKKIGKCTLFLENTKEASENPVLEEVVNETKYKEKLTYRTETYIFKGKRYKKKFVNRYTLEEK